MATKGSITLRGRYPAGTVVRLVKVRDETVLRSEGGQEVDVKKVSDDGSVTFKSGVDVGSRYFAVGLVGGFPLEVRLTGRESDEDGNTFQAPVAPDRVRLSDGSWADEAPESRKAGYGGVGPAPAVEQARGELLRSDTLRGYAHPVEKGEEAPYPRQEDVPKGTVQRSDTETGQATPVEHAAPNSQTDVGKGTLQRSATPYGYATPVPSGDAVEAQRDRESAETKASVGEPVKAAAHPPSEAGKAKDVDRDKAVVGPFDAVVPPEPVAGDEPDGRDALGQPLPEDVAKAAGIESADKPAAPVRAHRSKSSKKS